MYVDMPILPLSSSELSACPVTAKETIYELSVCPELSVFTTMEVISLSMALPVIDVANLCVCVGCSSHDGYVYP